MSQVTEYLRRSELLHPLPFNRQSVPLPITLSDTNCRPAANGISYVRGHSTARSRSRRLCLNECITQLSDTLGINHLFKVALAELALQSACEQYFGNAKWPGCFIIRSAAHSAAPTNGTSRLLEEVFSLCHGCSRISRWGTASVNLISERNRPQASARRTPVSLIRVNNQCGSSSTNLHSS